MKITNMVVALLTSTFLVSMAWAQTEMTSSLHQPVSIHQTAFEQGNYASYAPETAEKPAAPAPAPAAASACCEPSCCEPSCRDSRHAHRCGCEPWTLPQPACLSCRGIKLGGWIEQGISAVATSPTDGYNGVVTFNDRDGEYQLNQLWFYLEREVDNGGYGWDIGGRVDFVYGTDARFTQAADGLEANWNQTERFYQAALPQFYLDIAYNDWLIKMGHFYTFLGYEVVPAPYNFFYSHSYTMQYAEPFTHTGMLFTRKLGDQWSVTAGIHRGIDQFDDTDGWDTVNFLFGANWNSYDERLSLAFGLNASEQSEFQGPDFVPGNVTDYSLVGTVKVTDNLTWVIQHDYIQKILYETAGTNQAEGYGLNQYLLYEINPCWAAGVRFEWFRDDDGAFVRGLGDHNAAAAGGFAGDFYEITLGVNWTPRSNVIVRPEIRWDWFEPDAGITAKPYDAGNLDYQFLFGCDFIVTY